VLRGNFGERSSIRYKTGSWPGALLKKCVRLPPCVYYTRRGGQGVYFRNPNGHILELLTR
jgi:hypothetical protein